MTLSVQTCHNWEAETFFLSGPSHCLWSLSALKEIAENALRGVEGRGRKGDSHSGC